MLVEERRQRLLELVSRRGFAGLGDLAEAIDASESTIRRDLEHLYRLCEGGTDRNRCAQTWATISR